MVKPSHLLAALLALALVGCGGGGDDEESQSASAVAVSQDATAVDGLARFNYWRRELGLAEVTRNPVLDTAAKGHSDYQALNRVISHYQSPGNRGFTGECMGDSSTDPRCPASKVSRLEDAGFSFARGSYAFGEVISRTAGNSGAAAAEALIAAIYHRFVIFEPMFKEAGAAASSVARGSTYFTTNFVADGLDTGIGRGNFVVYPLNGQTAVPRNFFSDQEVPDPVPGRNEVGYPISVHADIFYTPAGDVGRAVQVSVDSFSIRPVGGAVLPAQRLWLGVDPATPASGASIVPHDPLAPNTTYEVRFSGTWLIRNGNGAILEQVPMNRTWTFTTGA